MTDFVISYEFMSMLAIFTYWIPASICAITYFFRVVALYKADLSMCNDKHYHPDLTVGYIIWIILCAVTPGVNLFSLVFDCAASIFKSIGKTFDVPLVRHRPD